MALATAGLNDLTGLFPGAGPATAVQDLGQGVDMNGYIGIPLNSIKFTGSSPNRWTVDENGLTAKDVTDGEGISQADDLTCATGSFRNFMRGVHETAYNYTTGLLTGDNAFTYWNEGAGNFAIYDTSTLTRRYTTDLYYELTDSQASKSSN